MGINVLSLFDGISCGQLAFERAGIKVDNYYASEIDKNAIKVTQKNYPNTIQLGNINNCDAWDLPQIDIIIGGSPCQDFSTLSRTRNSLNGKKSGLFYRFADCLEKFAPKYFLLENNASMPQGAKDEITQILGVKPISINSKLVSAQFRNRMYWTNIKNIRLPLDKNILLSSVLQFKNEINPVIWLSDKLEIIKNKYVEIPHICCPYNLTKIKDKAYCLTAQGNSQTKSSSIIIYENSKFYMLTATAWEILQTLPIGYTQCLIKENLRKTVIGNGWTVDVIAHILKNLNE